MGTRNLTCVVQNHEYKITKYGQWDGYPSGLGAELLAFLKNVNWWQFVGNLNKIKFLKTKEEQSKVNWRNYRNTTGAEYLKGVEEGKEDFCLWDLDFAKDSLYCEWCYVIDLDKNTFEIYTGFNKTPNEKEDRFYLEHSDNGYFAVKLVKSYNLNSLPSEEIFLSELEPLEDN